MIGNALFDTNDVRRITDENDEYWWVAKDVCLKLGLENSRRALMTLDQDEKSHVKIQTKGGLQNLSVINESGLYHLIFKSRKPEAIKFQDWVCDEVLPSIRKYGFYATSEAIQKSLDDSEYLDAVIEEIKRIKEEEQRSSKGCYYPFPIDSEEIQKDR
jgi:anti-repressor protein